MGAPHKVDSLPSHGGKCQWPLAVQQSSIRVISHRWKKGSWCTFLLPPDSPPKSWSCSRTVKYTYHRWVALLCGPCKFNSACRVWQMVLPLNLVHWDHWDHTKNQAAWHYLLLNARQLLHYHPLKCDCSLCETALTAPVNGKVETVNSWHGGHFKKRSHLYLPSWEQQVELQDICFGGSGGICGRAP